MKTASSTVTDRAATDRTLTPARASLMLSAVEEFYLRGQSRSAIATLLGISRFKVARLIDDAVELGMVNIQITRPDGIDPTRAEALRRAWGLTSCIVVPWLPDDNLQFSLAEAAASYLTEHLTENDVLGLASGRTTGRISRQLRSLPRCTVVQIAGVTTATTPWDSPTETIRRLTQLSGGEAYPIYAPFLLSTREVAEVMRREPGVQDAVRQFDQISHAVVTAGPWKADMSMIHDTSPVADQRRVAMENPAAELLGNILDAKGQQIALDYSERRLAIDLAQLRAVRNVILVTGGAGRQDAVLASLRSGVVNTLITDSRTAQHVLTAGKE